MTPQKFRALHDGSIYKAGWHVVTLDELIEHIGIEFGVPENVLAFSCSEGTSHRTASTGLTDKNGVEIFEGDILDWNGIGTATVVWSDGDADFLLDYPDGSFGGFDTRPTLNGLSSAKSQYYTVIGNMYQNPDLVPQSA